MISQNKRQKTTKEPQQFNLEVADEVPVSSAVRKKPNKKIISPLKALTQSLRNFFRKSSQVHAGSKEDLVDSKKIEPIIKAIETAYLATHHNAIKEYRQKNKSRKKNPTKKSLKCLDDLILRKGKSKTLPWSADLLAIATSTKNTIKDNNVIDLKALNADIVKQRAILRQNKYGAPETLIRLYVYLLLVEENRQHYGPAHLEAFFKEIRLCLLVIKAEQKRLDGVNKHVAALFEEIEKITGTVPILNNPPPFLPQELEKCKDKDLSTVRRRYLFDEQKRHEMDGTKENKIQTNVTAQLFGKEQSSIDAYEELKSTQTNHKVEYWMSYSDGNFMETPEDLQADHLQPEANILKRLNEFTEAMNVDSDFAVQYEHLAKQTGFKKVAGKWELTAAVERRYCNCPDNLWLIRNSTNHAKSDIDVIDYLKLNGLYGERFIPAETSEEKISKKCILYTMEGEILAKKAKEWFRNNHLVTLEVSQALSQMQQLMRSLGIVIDALPPEIETRKARNNTTFDIYVLLSDVRKRIDDLETKLLNRMNPELSSGSCTINTAEVKGI